MTACNKLVHDILAYHDAFNKCKMGTQSIKKVYESLALDLSNTKIINIAGTNGKGSTALFLGSLIKSCGKKGIVYTNPMVTELADLILIDNQKPSYDILLDAMQKVKDSDPLILDRHSLVILSMLVIASEINADIVVLEVGAGGTHDPVNGIEPDVSIVTSISEDHMNALGNTLDAIGLVKAGIYRSGKPALFGGADVPQSVIDYAMSIGALYKHNGEHFMHSVTNTPFPEENAQTAIQALVELGINPSDEEVVEAVSSYTGIGYFDTYTINGITIITDRAHNKAGMKYLVDRIRSEIQIDNRVTVIASFYEDKTESHQSMIEDLDSIATHWVNCGINKNRLMQPSEMIRLIRMYGSDEKPILCFKFLNTALDHIIQNGSKGDLVIITGCLPYTSATKSYVGGVTNGKGSG